MKRLRSIVALTGAVLSVSVGAQGVNDWPGVGGDPGGMKYSPLAEMTPANVSRLKEAWTYDPGGPAPIVINNTMYFVAAGNVVALKADSGTEAWKFPLSRATPGAAVRRGMT